MKFTPEQVIEMAREAGWCVPDDAVTAWIARQTRLCTLAADRALEAAAHDADTEGVEGLHVVEDEIVADWLRAMNEHQ